MRYRGLALLAVPVILTCVSCAPKRVASRPQPLADASFYTAANDFAFISFATPAREIACGGA